jgi:hypothetical protein
MLILNRSAYKTGVAGELVKLAKEGGGNKKRKATVQEKKLLEQKRK